MSKIIKQQSSVPLTPLADAARAKLEVEECDGGQLPQHTVSTPLPPLEAEVELKKQISAPSYFHSLAENDLPPFRIPVKEPRPRILISLNPLVSKEDVVQMVAAYEVDPDNGLRKFLGPFLIEKKVTKNYDLVERGFLIRLLCETIDYAAKRDFNAFKLSVLFTIYLTTHMYFKWFYWAPPLNVWNYFKELMIRHTIEDSPDGVEVFEPDECYDIVTHFHTIYMCNLPLVHLLTFGAYRINLGWAFKHKGK